MKRLFLSLPIPIVTGFGGVGGAAQVQKAVRHHGHYFKASISPYVVSENPSSGLLPRIGAESPGENGQADRRIQAYCFRMCLTQFDLTMVAPMVP